MSDIFAELETLRSDYADVPFDYEGIEREPVHHSRTTITQKSTQGILLTLGLDPEELACETILDNGSGYRQQFARDMEELGATVISIDPNLPHTAEFKAHKKETDIRGAIAHVKRTQGPLAAMLEELTAQEEMREYFRSKDVDVNRASNATRTRILAEYVEQHEDWPKEAYGKAVAGLGQTLPLADRSVDRIIATTSVPFALEKKQIPYMLAEACRVLRGKGKTAHFWPIVAETDIYNELELPEIRDLVKKARKEAETKEEKEALSGFGLAVYENPILRVVFDDIKRGLPSGAGIQTKSLVLTRKTA